VGCGPRGCGLCSGSFEVSGRCARARCPAVHGQRVTPPISRASKRLACDDEQRCLEGPTIAIRTTPCFPPKCAPWGDCQEGAPAAAARASARERRRNCGGCNTGRAPPPRTPVAPKTVRHFVCEEPIPLAAARSIQRPTPKRRASCGHAARRGRRHRESRRRRVARNVAARPSRTARGECVDRARPEHCGLAARPAMWNGSRTALFVTARAAPNGVTLVDTPTNNEHCGGCGHAAPAARRTERCAGSSFDFDCATSRKCDGVCPDLRAAHELHECGQGSAWGGGGWGGGGGG